MGWVISLANEWKDYSNPTILGKGRDFQELGYSPRVDHLWSARELPWYLWVRHLHANVLQWVYNEV